MEADDGASQATPRLFDNFFFRAEGVKALLSTGRPLTGTHNFLQPNTAKHVKEVWITLSFGAHGWIAGGSEEGSTLAQMPTNRKRGDPMRPSAVHSTQSLSAAISQNLVREFSPQNLDYMFTECSGDVRESWVPIAALRQLALHCYTREVDTHPTPSISLHFVSLLRIHPGLIALIHGLFLDPTGEWLFPMVFTYFKDCFLIDDGAGVQAMLAKVPWAGLFMDHAYLPPQLSDGRLETVRLNHFELFIDNPSALGHPIESVLNKFRSTIAGLALGCSFLEDIWNKWLPTSSIEMVVLADLTLRTFGLLEPCLRLWRLPALEVFKVAVYLNKWPLRTARRSQR